MMTTTQQAILKQVHDRAREEYIMILSDECEQVVKEIFEKDKPKRVLEIGTAIGYSSSVMALSGDCVIDTIEKDGSRIVRAKELWQQLGISDRIICYHGNADEILDSVTEGKTYDFVFIDGAKSAYKRQLEAIRDRLDVGGIVVCDDVLYFGLVEYEGVIPHKHRTIARNMREFLSYVTDGVDFDVKIDDGGNGILILRKK